MKNSSLHSLRSLTSQSDEKGREMKRRILHSDSPILQYPSYSMLPYRVEKALLDLGKEPVGLVDRTTLVIPTEKRKLKYDWIR